MPRVRRARGRQSTRARCSLVAGAALQVADRREVLVERALEPRRSRRATASSLRSPPSRSWRASASAGAEEREPHVRQRAAGRPGGRGHADDRVIAAAPRELQERAAIRPRPRSGNSTAAISSPAPSAVSNSPLKKSRALTRRSPDLRARSRSPRRARGSTPAIPPPDRRGRGCRRSCRRCGSRRARCAARPARAAAACSAISGERSISRVRASARRSGARSPGPRSRRARACR